MKIEKHNNYEHNYDTWNNRPAKCLIDIFYLKSPARPEGYDTIVLFRELQDNKGLSVTNYSEKLAESMLELHNLDYDKTVFIEGYPMYFDREGENYALIKYDKDEFGLSSPDWVDLERHSKKLFNFIKNNATEYPLDMAH